jgi:hypothetical protein
MRVRVWERVLYRTDHTDISYEERIRCHINRTPTNLNTSGFNLHGCIEWKMLFLNEYACVFFSAAIGTDRPEG